MKTAKELAFNAFCQGMRGNSIFLPEDHEVIEMENKFNIWWSKVYDGSENRGKDFVPDHSVWIDGKRYIQAE